MKKLTAVSLFLVLAASISYMIISNKPISSKRETIWVCPRDEEIRYIQTAEKPEKLYVTTVKGESQIIRAVYGPDKAEVLLTIPGKTSPWNHPIQGYDPNEFLISSSYKKSHRRYIHNFATGKDTDIKSVKGIYLLDAYRPFSPDGKWLALNGHTSDIKTGFKIYIINRQSGSITPLSGIDTNHSHHITWTRKGLMTFYGDSGILYKGDENGVKPIKKVGRSTMGFVTPDGNDLITLEWIANHGILLKSYNLENNRSRVIYKGYSKPSKEELDALSIATWFNSQYSQYSDEMTVSMNWPPVKPVYIGKNRRGKEIPLQSKSDLLYSRYGVAIWKPGIVAYAKGENIKKHPNVILSVKMD
ncbi:MAG: hypothetical protein ACYC27_18055 [Armatimonadota bacterium]